jgi:hypothetical protein
MSPLQDAIVKTRARERKMIMHIGTLLGQKLLVMRTSTKKSLHKEAFTS